MRAIQLKSGTKVIELFLRPGIACGEQRHSDQRNWNQKPHPQENLRFHLGL